MPSQDVETILLNRHNSNLTDSELYHQVVDLQRQNLDLKEQVSQLQSDVGTDTLLAEIEVLNDANNELKQQVEELTSEKESLFEKNNQLTANALILSLAEKESILTQVTTLKEKYPNLSTNQLIEASLFVTIKNEFSRIWIRRIDYYLKLQQKTLPLQAMT